MGEFLADLFLPSTDRAVAIQLAVVIPLFATWIWFARHHKDHRLFATGVTVFTLSFFALRTLH